MRGRSVPKYLMSVSRPTTYADMVVVRRGSPAASSRWPSTRLPRASSRPRAGRQQAIRGMATCHSELSASLVLHSHQGRLDDLLLELFHAAPGVRAPALGLQLALQLAAQALRKNVWPWPAHPVRASGLATACPRRCGSCARDEPEPGETMGGSTVREPVCSKRAVTAPSSPKLNATRPRKGHDGAPRAPPSSPSHGPRRRLLAARQLSLRLSLRRRHVRGPTSASGARRAPDQVKRLQDDLWHDAMVIAWWRFRLLVACLLRWAAVVGATQGPRRAPTPPGRAAPASWPGARARSGRACRGAPGSSRRCCCSIC